MNCRDIEPLIYLVRDGELTEKEKSIVSQHIQVCAGCNELFRSVKVMTDKILKADYNEGIHVQDELFLHRLLTNIRKPVRVSSITLIKTVAACVLLFLTSAFVFQEYKFYRERSDLQVRMQKSEYQNSENGGISECVQEIKRRIHSKSLTSFARSDSVPMNLISEEALTRYVKERCGYNASDIKTLKKMLIQAGLIN